MAEAMQAFKTTLTKTKSGSEQDDLEIGGLTSFGGIKVDTDEIDVTNFSSGNYKESIPGKKDAGEVPIEGFVIDEEQFAKMAAIRDSDVIEEWTIKFKSGATLVVQAWVKSFGNSDLSLDGAVGFTGSIRITGKPVFTAAATS